MVLSLLIWLDVDVVGVLPLGILVQNDTVTVTDGNIIFYNGTSIDQEAGDNNDKEEE